MNINKSALKFLKKCKRPECWIPIEGEKQGELTLSDFKSFWTSRLSNQGRGVLKSDRQREEWTERSNKNVHTKIVNWSLTKKATEILLERIAFQHTALKPQGLHMAGKINLDTDSTLSTKISLKWIIDLNVKYKSIKP